MLEPAILIGTLLFTLFAVFMVFFIALYRRKQQQHRSETALLRQELLTAGLQSRVEIIEHTLQGISQEIHDNIGQKLTLAGMYIEQLPGSDPQLKDNAVDLIHRALDDLRDLSKSLSGDYVLKQGIELALERELGLLRQVGVMDTRFTCKGEKNNLSEEQEVILFRCAQEAMSNAIRHSKGSLLEVEMHQSPSRVRLLVRDNGRGIDQKAQGQGLGTGSMIGRMTLLNGTCQIHSNNGTTVTLEVPTNPT